MGEFFLELSAGERRDVLALAAQRSARPAYLLEKDVWVVWVLGVLFRAGFGDALVFKGGTSLSKGYGIIDRFSEDVDLTYDIRRMLAALDAHGEVPISRSQAKVWTDAVRKALPAWLDREVMPVLQQAAMHLSELRIERAGTQVHVWYGAERGAPGYVLPGVAQEKRTVSLWGQAAMGRGV